MVRWLALVTLLLLTACGTDAAATATRQAERNQIATLTAPTATPPYARLRALDVVQAFMAAGLRAQLPYPTSSPLFAQQRDTVYDFLPRGESTPIFEAMIVTTTSPGELQARVAHIDENNRGSLIRYEWQIRYNVIVVFSYIARGAAPNLTRYWAVLASTP